MMRWKTLRKMPQQQDVVDKKIPQEENKKNILKGILLPVFTSPHTKDTILKILVPASIFIFAAVIIRRAWVCDDAYITFRTVDNFVNGYGLKWNILERVQSYTHPLWLFLFSGVYFFTREAYYTSIILSIILSLAALILLYGFISKSAISALFGVLVLTLSNAYVDYATSGLENPLTHLLLVIFWIIYFRSKPTEKHLFTLSLVASLAGFNRLDILLLLAPALLYQFLQLRTWKAFFTILAGQFPLILWLCFSLLYYGFAFPNTAYAKLNTAIPSIELLRQGLHYVQFTLRYDLITVFMITLGLLAGSFSRDNRNYPVAIGMLFYFIYLLRIGGDFMGGRFFTAILLCAVVLIVRVDFLKLKPQIVTFFFIGVILLGITAPLPTYRLLSLEIQQNPDRPIIDPHGIADERQSYFLNTGLIYALRGVEIPNHYNVREGTIAREEGVFSVHQPWSIGFFGYYAGPNVYVVDGNALADPLLARLPAVYTKNWRIGHFYRAFPAGYFKTLETGQDHFNDRDLAEYYEKLSLITQGDIFLPQRFATIWKMNTGQYDHLVNESTYRHFFMVFIDLADLSERKPETTPTDLPGNVHFSDSGIEIQLEELSFSNQIDITLDNNDDYLVLYLCAGKEIASQTISGLNKNAGLTHYILAIPLHASQGGFDKIQIYPLYGDGSYTIGHLLLSETGQQ